MKKIWITLLAILVCFAAVEIFGTLRDAYYRRPFSDGRLIGLSPEQVIASVGQPLEEHLPATWPTDEAFTYYYYDGGGTPWEIHFDKASHVQSVECGPWKAERGWHAT